MIPTQHLSRLGRKATLSDALIAEARRRKLNVIEACSIVGIGRNPYSL